jgi:hypothetical protein
MKSLLTFQTPGTVYQQTSRTIAENRSLQQYFCEDLIRLSGRLISVNISTKLTEVKTFYSLIVLPCQYSIPTLSRWYKRDSVARLRTERSGVRFSKGVRKFSLLQNPQTSFEAHTISVFSGYRGLFPLG